MGLRFGVLGPLQVWRDAQEVSLGTIKQRLLLAVLLQEPNRTICLDRLVAALWDESPPKSAISNLRSYANRLRTALAAPEGDREFREPRIVGRRPGYALTVNPGELDSAEFIDLLQFGQAELARNQPRRAVAQLTQGLALWRGRPAEDLPRTMVLEPWLASLEEQRCLALETIAGARLMLREHHKMIPELRDLLAIHPTRERLWGHLMLALYRSGDVAAALAAFTSARDVLAEELGIDPGPELISLHQAMLRRDPELGGYPRSEPALPPSRTRCRWPAPSTLLVCHCGRRRPRQR
jgi:DNA-binding SARP family transcriptional activator